MKTKSKYSGFCLQCSVAAKEIDGIKISLPPPYFFFFSPDKEPESQQTGT